MPIKSTASQLRFGPLSGLQVEQTVRFPLASAREQVALSHRFQKMGLPKLSLFTQSGKLAAATAALKVKKARVGQTGRSGDGASAGDEAPKPPPMPEAFSKSLSSFTNASDAVQGKGKQNTRFRFAGAGSGIKAKKARTI